MHHGYAAQWGLSPVPTQYKPDSVDVLYATMGDLEYHQCLLGYHRTIPSVNSLASNSRSMLNPSIPREFPFVFS